MNELFRALPALMKEFEDNETVREAVVFAAWRKIAGDALRFSAVPAQLSGKRLTVAVSGESWRKHLEHLSGQMIFKINSKLGLAAVTFIEFRIDETTVKAERAKFHKTEAKAISEEAALNEITPKMRHKADAIKDDDLRYQFLLAAGSCLVRKKNMKKAADDN
ncbi:MAG TPA: DciA family protein [Pyrinomonadaceae bacterium]|nr:DciA family protein [Pyrinomonadaceae bacterium]